MSYRAQQVSSDSRPRQSVAVNQHIEDQIEEHRAASLEAQFDQAMISLEDPDLDLNTEMSLLNTAIALCEKLKGRICCPESELNRLYKRKQELERTFHMMEDIRGGKAL